MYQETQLINQVLYLDSLLDYIYEHNLLYQKSHREDHMSKSIDEEKA
jgi:hypothetical protein